MLVSEVDQIYFICCYSFPRFSIVCRCPFSFDGVKYGASPVKYDGFALKRGVLYPFQPTSSTAVLVQQNGRQFGLQVHFQTPYTTQYVASLHIKMCVCHSVTYFEQIWTNESLSIIINKITKQQDYCHLPAIHKPTQFTYM